MSFNAPRPRDAIVAKLHQLHTMRGRVQAELIDRLMILDSIDRSIDATLAELASARGTVP